MTVTSTLFLDPAPPPVAPGLTAVECGVETIPAGHVFPPRRIVGAALLATEQGSASARVGAHEVQHRTGSLVAIAPDFELTPAAATRGSSTHLGPASPTVICPRAGPAP